MSYRFESRLKRLETQEQQQGMPPVFVVWDDDKLPWDAPDNCLIVRLARTLPVEEWQRQTAAMLERHKHMTPEQIWEEWHTPVEREAPPPHRQQP